MEKALPSIPAKRYFTIGEVSDLCGVKPYVLRYWEQEFTQLKPMKRRGNRRYYQHHEVLLIRRIRDLLYEQGFTISGARNRLTEAATGRGQPLPAANGHVPDDALDLDDMIEELEAEGADAGSVEQAVNAAATIPQPEVSTIALSMPQIRQELISIRGLLVV
jgi:DNA-binding transcriptional MerR regulator